MISLVRIRSKRAVSATLRGPKRVDKLLLLVEGQRAGAVTFKRSYWKAAKRQLIRESAGKCAYCEADTTVVAHGDVEHFRPKSIYWWLAYCYDNYLYACQICNEAYKGDQFPIGAAMLAEPILPDVSLDPVALRAAVALFTPDPFEDSEGMPMATFRRLVQDEQALLPNPYFEDPELLFGWVADPTLKEVSVEPRNAPPGDVRARAAIDVYGLNRDELKRVRWDTYRALSVFRDAIEARVLPPVVHQEVLDHVREMTDSSHAFSGMVRYFVRDEWRLDLS